MLTKEELIGYIVDELYLEDADNYDKKIVIVHGLKKMSKDELFQLMQAIRGAK